jgi:hypothetical protein
MGEQYGQLTLEERCSIASLRAAGQSIRQIAAALDRQPSTISRELKRNCGNKVGYQPAYAQQQTHARRWSGSRLERDQTLRDEVLGCLRDGCSPEQVAGRLARETHQSAGSCSDQRGWGRDIGSGAVACSAMAPSGDMMIAFTPEVPMSMPRNMQIALPGPTCGAPRRPSYSSLPIRSPIQGV